MKAAVILATASATLALANPVVKREIKTEVVFEYVTVTVQATGPSPTAVAVPTTPAAVGTTSSDTTTSDTTNQAGAFFSAASSDEPATTQASAPSTGGNVSGLSDYAAAVLKQHNYHRANHSAVDLVWDDYLTNAAQALAATCIYGHDTSVLGGGYGQNIGADSVGPNNLPSLITNGMYDNEMINYNAYGGEPDGNDLDKWGHFTQIVWKGTTKVGCATVQCPNLMSRQGSSLVPVNGMDYFHVCNYGPPGNYGGEYGANVGKPLGQPSITL